MGRGTRVRRYELLLLLVACSLCAGILRKNDPLGCLTCGCKKREDYPTVTSCAPGAMTNCHGGHHGFGNQLAILMASYNFALKQNMEFCPTRWTYMAHLDINGSAPKYGSKMFDFIGGPNYGHPASYSTKSMWNNRDQVFSKRALLDVRRFYFASKEPKRRRRHAHNLRRREHNMTFVWQVRGGDMNPPSSTLIIEGLKQLKKKYKQMKSLAFISHGMPSDYGTILDFCYTKLGVSCSVKLAKCREDNVDPDTAMRNLQKDFHRMVTADVFVRTGYSTLGSTAAILNKHACHVDQDLADGNDQPQSFSKRWLALEALLNRAEEPLLVGAQP